MISSSWVTVPPTARAAAAALAVSRAWTITLTVAEEADGGAVEVGGAGTPDVARSAPRVAAAASPVRLRALKCSMTLLMRLSRSHSRGNPFHDLPATSPREGIRG